jgi:hypothetical protein
LMESESVLAWRDELDVLKDRLGPLGSSLLSMGRNLFMPAV